MNAIHYTLDLDYRLCNNYNCLCGSIYLRKCSKILSAYNLDLERKKPHIWISVDEDEADNERLVFCKFIIFSTNHTIKLPGKWEHLATISPSNNSSLYYDIFCTVKLKSPI